MSSYPHTPTSQMCVLAEVTEESGTYHTHVHTHRHHVQRTLCSASLRDPPSEPVMTAESHLPQGHSPFPEGPTPNGHLTWQACLLISMLKNHLIFRAFCGSARAFTETTSPHDFSFHRSLPKDWSLTNVLYGNLHLSLHSREQNHILHKKLEGKLVLYYSICHFTKVK